MTPTDSIVESTVASMIAIVDSIPELTRKVLHVYAEDELAARLKGLSYPCAAVVYDGMTGVPKSGGGIGASGNMVLTIMIFFRLNTMGGQDNKGGILALLDELRLKVRRSKSSPTGHGWQFLREAPAQGKTGILAYVQTWSTPVQLV